MHGEDEEDFGAHPGDDWSDDEPLRGWVPPDDRLWLHPSERSATAAAGSGPPMRQPVRVTRVAGGLTACLVVTLVVVAFVVSTTNDTTSSSPATLTGVPTTEADLSALADSARMDAAASSDRDSTVALVVRSGSGTSIGTGVVAEAGGIIVALEPTVAGARDITVVEPDGTRQDAVLVGSDQSTRIAVLRIADDLPAADFTTDDPEPGTLAVAMSEESRAPGRPITHLYAGTVVSAGAAGWDTGVNGLCETVVAAPLSPDDMGSPLVDDTGAVVGIFETVVGQGRARTAIFLPAQLVRDVTAQIVSRGMVVHGFLGVGVDDAPPGSPPDDAGAVVVSLDADGSAARAGIEPGDRIVSIDDEQVHSVAELATRLYAEPPGTELPVTFVRDGVAMTTAVVLGTS